MTDKLLWGIREMCFALSLTSSSIYRHVDAGLLPKPRKFGGRNMWLPEEVRAAVRKNLAA